MTDGTIPLQPAATVMLVRDADGGGVEVFMVRRVVGAAFAAGSYVFPGGRVDAADAGQGIEAVVVGIDDGEASATLGLSAGGLAFWVAAIRECFEEAGMLLAVPRRGGPLPVLDGERWAVHRGELSMLELCRRHDVVLDGGALRYVSHWVTPAGNTRRRFDTRFFLAVAPAGQDGRHDDAELDESRWIEPAAALAAADRGEIALMQPTIANLRLITDCATVDDATPPRVRARQVASRAAVAAASMRAVQPDMSTSGTG